MFLCWFRTKKSVILTIPIKTDRFLIWNKNEWFDLEWICGFSMSFAWKNDREMVKTKRSRGKRWWKWECVKKWRKGENLWKSFSCWIHENKKKRKRREGSVIQCLSFSWDCVKLFIIPFIQWNDIWVSDDNNSHNETPEMMLEFNKNYEHLF